jgi:hypothetical protein
VLLGEHRADEADDRGAIGEGSDDAGPPANLPVQAFLVEVGPRRSSLLAQTSVSPARSPNRLCGIPHNGLYVQSMVMLRMGLVRCVFAAEGGFEW